MSYNPEKMKQVKGLCAVAMQEHAGELEDLLITSYTLSILEEMEQEGKKITGLELAEKIMQHITLRNAKTPQELCGLLDIEADTLIELTDELLDYTVEECL